MGLLDGLFGPDIPTTRRTAQVTPADRDQYGQWYRVDLHLMLTRGMVGRLAEVLEGCGLKVEAGILRGAS